MLYVYTLHIHIYKNASILLSINHASKGRGLTCELAAGRSGEHAVVVHGRRLVLSRYTAQHVLDIVRAHTHVPHDDEPKVHQLGPRQTGSPRPLSGAPAASGGARPRGLGCGDAVSDGSVDAAVLRVSEALYSRFLVFVEAAVVIFKYIQRFIELSHQN